MASKLIRRLIFPALAACMLLCALVPAAAAEPAGAGTSSALSLTQEEQDYVKSHGTLRVGFVQDRIPVSFTDENGELAGISRYIFDRIARLSGLTFEYVPLPAGSITYDYLTSQRLDLVTSVEYNGENQQARGILLSQPYLSSRKVVVARQGLEFSYSAPLTVAVSSGSQTLHKALNDTYPSFELEDYDSITDCFDAVKSGDSDLMIQNQYLVEYWISKPAYEDLKVIPVLGLADEMCFSAVVAFDDRDAPSAEDGHVLIDILNKSIDALTEDEVGSYTIQAIMENQYEYSLSDFLYRYRSAVGILIAAALIIVVLAVLLSRQRLRSLAAQTDAKTKDEFLSAMSHEVRTPLNGLVGLNYLMAQNLDDRERMEGYLKQSSSTAKYLLGLINDILDLSRLREHRVQLQVEPVDLELLFSTVAALVREPMSEKMLRFQVDAQLPWPCVAGDEVRIQQVLFNLLDNARKFTPRGGRVDLIVRQTLEEDGSVTTRAEVADTGRGMSEEFQRHIFDAFAQELETVSKGNQGTGLGLPISRRLARLMGGEITFTSRKDVGSRFFFTFPARPAAMPEKAGEVPPRVEAAKPAVLVAEDNELNAEIMLDLLGDEGFDVTLAKDGQEALDLFKASDPYTFGVILMDLLMPRLDGYQAAAAIRALDREDARTVYIIACTANSQEEGREKALECGMDDFVPKPVDIDALLQKIYEHRG